MKVLVLGATGLLGTEIMQVLQERGIRALGAARSGADLTVNIADPLALFRLLVRVDADTVINCAANVNLAQCEDDPEMAYRVNGAPAGVLSAWSQQTDGRFLQVSTDNYFTGTEKTKHDEQAIIGLANAYAASKFSGETMAREAPNSLVVRTNICGARKGFGRWVLDSLTDRAPIGVFTDYYTSTMHVRACAEALADLLVTKHTGLVHLGSSEVSSKAEFVRAVADELQIDPDWIEDRSARGMSPARALSCGMDVSKAESWLGRKLPGLSETVRSLVSEDERCVTHMTSNLAAAG
ncbi:MAG: NAD(P)-dependent oxidoreductase [Ponticaulis sp.]|nr:NAD(P)-dependent oxidoreductase [Ponticaulis sp.]|tara:strand:+ start:37081 stop:37965 length:885 start_codon:yes stop_codon:yes gene_type:complete